MAIRMVTGDLIEQAAAWAATPVGMITILIAAVYGITKAYDLFTVSLDEHRQKLDDLKSKYDEFELKLQSIQSELETATQRIVELEAKDNLTFMIFTGILGNLCAPALARLFRVKDPVAAGLAIGACSHAMGTARALELGETEGAMSGLAIGLCGLATTILALFFDVLV